MKLHITLCTPDDLASLTQMARKTFVDAFAVHNKPADFKEYMRTAFAEQTFEKQLLNPNCQFFFVKTGKNVVGYFKLNENDAQTELKGTESLELERIYVIQEYQGHGIGKWILQRAIALAKQKGKALLWLGVWEHNTEAIRFYQRHGFTKFGEHPYYVGSDKQMDWLMRLDLPTLNA